MTGRVGFSPPCATGSRASRAAALPLVANSSSTVSAVTPRDSCSVSADKQGPRAEVDEHLIAPDRTSAAALPWFPRESQATALGNRESRARPRPPVDHLGRLRARVRSGRHHATYGSGWLRVTSEGSSRCADPTKIRPHEREAPNRGLFFFVPTRIAEPMERTGIEPVTSGLQSRRSPS
jgi:hypothetical protein